MDDPIAIGRVGREHLVVARQETHRDAGLGVRGRERVDEDGNAVGAGKRRKPEIEMMNHWVASAVSDAGPPGSATMT